jgi:hypothetical protein
MYIKKMAASYNWMPLSFPSDHTSWTKILQCVSPTTPEHQLELEHQMGFKYRNAMREVMYPTVKCHPNVSTHVIL